MSATKLCTIPIKAIASSSSGSSLDDGMWQYRKDASLRSLFVMSSTDSSPNAVRHHLQEVRSAFLRLHKALLDSERVLYEQFYGRIPSSGEFFRLVIGHEWFSWLRPMSQFIARVDETLSTKEPVTLEQANELLETARGLNRPSEEGTPQEQRYFYAIQRDPNVAIMYVEVVQLLTAKT